MAWLHRVKESPNYLRLKDSMEFRYIRRQVLIVGSFTALFLLLAVLLGVAGGGRVSSAKGTVSLVIGLMVMIPMTIYYVYRGVELFSSIGRYCFTETVLNEPHMGGKNSMYFTVTLRDRSGNEIKKDTSSLFSGWSDPCFDDCVNKKALIGYNDETDRVVVIKVYT